jgi:serine/threonine protein kinase
MEPRPFGEKYVLVEHLATGGMAEIYRAHYAGIEGFAKELVIKRLREEFAGRPEVVTMFLDEARVAATLSHNNVVHTYDLGEIHGEYFIAMELLKGEELVAILRRCAQSQIAMPRELAIGIVMQALEGLNYAHGRSADDGTPLGLVHRDINPTNLHVGYDGVVKVVDFGIAATRATALRGTQQFAGKLSYMAPEQMRGDIVDRRADIFPMGVLLYEMLLGRRLFRGSPEDVRRRVMAGDIPPPTFVDPAFPPELEAILMRALEVDPAKRYQNTDHMFRDLDAYVHEHGLAMTPRRISAFMAELFGAGAPANVDYEDQYDDVVDEIFDFASIDAFSAEKRAKEANFQAPSWARQVEPGAPRRRTMTIGNLEAFVADMKSDDSGARPGQGMRSTDPASTTLSAAAKGSAAIRPADLSTSAAPIVPLSNPAAAKSQASPAQKESAESRRATRPDLAVDVGRERGNEENRAASPRSTTRGTVANATHEPRTATGTFGQTVVAHQVKPTNPLWVAIFVLVSLAIGYYVSTVLTAK